MNKINLTDIPDELNELIEFKLDNFDGLEEFNNLFEKYISNSGFNGFKVQYIKAIHDKVQALFNVDGRSELKEKYISESLRHNKLLMNALNISSSRPINNKKKEEVEESVWKYREKVNKCVNE